MEEKRNNKVFICLKIILIVLILGFVCYIVYDNFFNSEKNIINNNTSTTTTNNVVDNNKKTIGKVEFSDNKYILDIDNYKENKEEVYYKINNDYEVKLIFNFDDNYEDFRTYDIYVNDKFVLTDDNFGGSSVYFNIINENLVYLNTGFTDIRCEHVYIVEKDNTIHNIYELDNITGMVPEKITLNNDSIVIEGTRLTHGISIVYDKSSIDDAMLEDDTTWAKYGITENTVIKATYTYNFDSNDKFISVPVVSNKTTIKEYLNNN